MRRKKFPKEIAIRKNLAEYLAKKDYTMFELCVLLGYTLRDYQLEVNSPFLSDENKRLIDDDEYREKVVDNLVTAMYRSYHQSSGDNAQ